MAEEDKATLKSAVVELMDSDEVILDKSFVLSISSIIVQQSTFNTRLMKVLLKILDENVERKDLEDLLDQAEGIDRRHIELIQSIIPRKNVV